MKRPTCRIRRVTHFRMVWRGITIKLKYHYQYTLACRHRDSIDHIEIYVIGADADLCPLTETGYRSIQLATRQLRTLGGPVAYVRRILSAAAADPRWIKTEHRRRQLDLFGHHRERSR